MPGYVDGISKFINSISLILMKTVKRSLKNPALVWTFIFFFAGITNAQSKETVNVTVREVLQKYVEATGGKNNLLKVKDKTVVLESVNSGIKVQIVIKQKAPGKFFQTIDFGTTEYETVFDGSHAKIVAMGQEERLTGKQLELLKIRALMYLPVQFEKSGLKPELTGVVRINGNDVYKVTFKTPSGTGFVQYFDKKSGLKIREEFPLIMNNQKFNEITEFGDYHEVRGVKYPFKLIQKAGDSSVEFNVKSIEINSGLDDNLFAAD